MIRRAAEWIVGDNTGLSSKHLWAVMMGARVSKPYHPADPADMVRCLKLLRAVPEWRGRLPEMASQGPQWARLVARWDEVETLIRAEIGGIDPAYGDRAPRAYELMKRIEEDR